MTIMMFVCDKCENVDSITLSHPTQDGYLCYRCLHGTWHGMFGEEKYDPQLHPVINRHNAHFNDNGEPSFG